MDSAFKWKAEPQIPAPRGAWSGVGTLAVWVKLWGLAIQTELRGSDKFLAVSVSPTPGAAAHWVSHGSLLLPTKAAGNGGWQTQAAGLRRCELGRQDASQLTQAGAIVCSAVSPGRAVLLI